MSQWTAALQCSYSLPGPHDTRDISKVVDSRSQAQAYPTDRRFAVETTAECLQK